MDEDEPRLVIRFDADPGRRAVLVKRGEETIDLTAVAHIQRLNFLGEMDAGIELSRGLMWPASAHCELTLQARRVEIEASASLVAAALQQPVKETGPMTVGTRLSKCGRCGHVQKEKPD